MAKSRLFAAQALEWVFHGKRPAWEAQTLLWISLHTGDPGSAQSDSETKYEGYKRQAIARQPTAMPIGADGATNHVVVEFPVCTGDGGGRVTHYGIGTDATGEGALLYSGLLDEPMTIQRRMAPRLPVGAMSVKEI